MTTDLFHWSDEFSVGLQEIDEQHKELVDLLDQLNVAIQAHHGSATSRAILDKLADYTRTHFAVEESLMRVSNYPDFAAHKQNHEELIGQVKALQAKLDSGQATITFELLHFLKVRLTHHINEADKRFGAFFPGHSLTARPMPRIRAFNPLPIPFAETMTMPLITRTRLALLSLALPAVLLAAAPAQAETLSCPALDATAQVAACPTDAELQYTFLGYCGDNARLYGRDILTCASFENYKAVKNTALWESANGAFSGYLNCNVEAASVRASKAVKMSVEKKGNLTRLICDYENDHRMVMRTKSNCTVEVADCSGGECRATCN